MNYYLFDKRFIWGIGIRKQELIDRVKMIFRRVIEETFESGCDVSIDGIVDIKGDLPYDEQVIVVNELNKLLANKKIGVFLRSPNIKMALKKYRDGKEIEKGEYAVQQADEISQPEQEKSSKSLSERY